MSSEGGGGDSWAFSESKDWKDGRHRRQNRHVLTHAGEIRNRTTRQAMTTIRRAYEKAYQRGWIDDEWPDSFEETEFYRDVRAYHDTESFSQRIEEGDSDGLRHHVGSQADEVDVSGWHDIERIRNVATDRNLRLYIYGEPGNGKTRSGCLVARHWLDERREEGHEDARVLTNIRTLRGEDPAIEWTSSWGSFKEKVYADMDDVLDENVPPTLFFFDEASSQAGGSGKDGYEAKMKLAVLVYKMRKFGCAIVIVGHDGKDLHPAVRELCKVLHKTDKKKARFYASVSNRKGKNPITPEITGWPDSMWSPNDKDPAPWSWGGPETGDSDENGEGIARDDVLRELALWTVVHEKTRELGKDDERLSFDKIANRRLGGLYSGEWCRRRWNEYDRGEHGETVGMIQQLIA